jgi:hypothetical protein
MEILETIVMILLGAAIVITAPYIIYVMYKSGGSGFHLWQKHGLFHFFKRGDSDSPGEQGELQEYRRMTYIIWAWGFAIIFFYILAMN